VVEEGRGCLVGRVCSSKVIGLWGGRPGAVVRWGGEGLLEFSNQILEGQSPIPGWGDVNEG
jgi:hypothetical protein